MPLRQPARKNTADKRRVAIMPWRLFATFALVFICIAGILVLRNTGREEKQMLAAMQDKADVLIWALEGGRRSIGRMEANPMALLVEEVAKQPGIAYIAVVNKDGRVIFHSDSSRVATLMQLPDSIAKEPNYPAEQSQGHFKMDKLEKIFEVYKRFTPAMAYMQGSPKGSRSMGRWRDSSPAPDSPASELFILVGMDAGNFDEKLNEYIWHSALLATLIALVGLAGFALLFYMQSYKLSRRMLEDTQVLAEHVVSSLPVGLIVTNKNGEIILYNQPGEAMLGLNHAENSPIFLHNLQLFDWNALLQELDAGVAVLERELELPIAKNKFLPVSVSASKIADSEGAASGYLLILRDMGEVRRLQKQIRLNERLSALGNLAAGVAHEIRNPLSSIKGYATYLTEKLKNDADAHSTGLLLIQETERLNRVVSDLLSVTKPLNLQKKPVPISSVIEQAVRLIMPDAEEKGVTVSITPPEDPSGTALYAALDTDRMVQAILNLLLNAVQATEHGGHIELSFEKLNGGTGSPSMAINISDSGSGMSAQTMGSLFTPYFTTKASGTGLGLTITHRIIEQHGGEIKVRSQPGKGSVFTVLLPIEHAERD